MRAKEILKNKKNYGVIRSIAKTSDNYDKKYMEKPKLIQMTSYL